MKRIFNIAAVIIGGVAAANAGSIEIGGGSGLTGTYITSNGGSHSGMAEVSFENTAFQGASPPSNPYPGYSPTSTTAGETLNVTNGALAGSAFAAPGGVTFAMIADSSQTANTWLNGSASLALTIPIGIFDVSDVATLLTDVYGVANATTTEVFFNFGTGSTVSQVVGVKLQDAGTTGSAASGQIGSSTTCLTQGTASSTEFANCQSLAGGTLAGSSTLTAYSLLTSTANNSTVFTSPTTTSSMTVDATSAYQQSYTSVTGNEFGGTTGTNQLDAQDFLFGSAYQNLTLISIGLVDTGFAYSIPANGTSNASATILAAVTADSATPEPSTWMLLLGGVVGLIGFRRVRRVGC